MGIRDRIKSRLKSGVSNIKALAAVIHDERLTIPAAHHRIWRQEIQCGAGRPGQP